MSTTEEFKEAGYAKCVRNFNFAAIPILKGEVFKIKKWGEIDGRKGCVLIPWYYGFVQAEHLTKHFKVPTDKKILMEQLK